MSLRRIRCKQHSIFLSYSQNFSIHENWYLLIVAVNCGKQRTKVDMNLRVYTQFNNLAIFSEWQSKQEYSYNSHEYFC